VLSVRRNIEGACAWNALAAARPRSLLWLETRGGLPGSCRRYRRGFRGRRQRLHRRALHVQKGPVVAASDGTSKA